MEATPEQKELTLAVADMSKTTQDTPDVKKATQQIRDLTALVKKYHKAIGHPGIKPEDIDAELGREIVQKLLGITTPAPHRFDIDQIK